MIADFVNSVNGLSMGERSRCQAFVQGRLRPWRKIATMSSNMSGDTLIIQGGRALKGEIEVLGSKNAALPLLAASTLFSCPIVLGNMPHIEDVFRMVEILESMGAKVTWMEKRTLQIDASSLDPKKINQTLVKSLRASLLFVGPLLSRFGHCVIGHPGGDAIGTRPLDTHFQAFKDLGVNILRLEHSDEILYEFDASGLHGGEVILEEFSVTATENVLMLVSRLKEKTTIKLAAAEPHVGDLIAFLSSAGVKITKEGDHTLHIQGNTSHQSVKHDVIPDYLEEGTFLVLSALFDGHVTIKNLSLCHLDAFRKKFMDMGIEMTPTSTHRVTKNLLPIKLQTLPYPGFPTDLQAPWMAYMSLAAGKSRVRESIFEQRFMHAAELARMGARIAAAGERAVIEGVKALVGAPIMASDIRAGAALVVGALAAQGQTVIQRVYHIDRGYERLEKKLRALGARIRRAH